MTACTGTAGITNVKGLIVARSEGKSLRAITTIYRRSPRVFISLADQLMYSLKNGGRNGVACMVHDGETGAGNPQLQLGDNFE